MDIITIQRSTEKMQANFGDEVKQLSSNEGSKISSYLKKKKTQNQTTAEHMINTFPFRTDSEVTK